ncbi:MAG TPA: FtsX-like permease family protein [Bryobacteraceae bacterium]|nr:FtsX-like permease family protein [Bryobacteraceae bacterium]
MKLLRTLILRPLRRDLLRTLLTLLAVALGVAVVVATDLAGAAATGSFRSSVETLVGSTDLRIMANGGVDESWIGRLTSLPIDAHFSPVIEAEAFLPGIGSTTLYGLDFVANAPSSTTGAAPETGAESDNAVVVSRALARRLHLAAGAALTAVLNSRRRQFHVVQIVDAKSAEFLALDIAAAQRALNRYGTLDRIDVTIAPGEDFARAERAIRGILPPSYLLEKPGARSEENQRMLRAFRWNLRILSYISLVVGAFLIYNAISVSVVRRRAEIGVLRALGAGRGAVFGLFLFEALLLGAIGAILGVGLGRLLAGGTVNLIAGTVNALYTTSRPAPVSLSFAEICTGILAGAAVAFAAAFAPAREALRVAPTAAMSRGAHEHQARLRWRKALAGSVILAGLALAASQAVPLGGKPVGGYVAALLAVGAAALAAPALILAVNRVTRQLLNRRVETLLAGRSMAVSLARTSVVVGALATAIAMMASVGIMVGSFRQTVLLWLNVQLRADLYVRPAGRSSVGEYPDLPSEVTGILRSTPGVAAVDDFRALEFHYRGERATFGASDMEIVRRFGRLRFLPGEDRDAILRLLPGSDRAIVSEPFANHFGVHAGDRLMLPIGGKNVTLAIAGIYYDYSSSQGYVMVDRSTLLRYLPGQPATSAAVYLEPGADANRVRRAIQLRTAAYAVAVAPNQQLRHDAIVIFDRTFAITWALEAVAIIVAMLGAANSLLALVLDRRRELGLLRYLGASSSQIRGTILTEAGFLGLVASLLGLALGFALSLLLIFVVNKQSFGWTIQFYPPRELLFGALLLVWCVTVLAGLYPARIAARLNPIDVIHEE